jgi:hypothetical protein
VRVTEDFVYLAYVIAGGRYRVCAGEKINPKPPQHSDGRVRTLYELLCNLPTHVLLYQVRKERTGGLLLPVGT